MPTFINPLTSMAGNTIQSVDGSAYGLYVCDGINYNPYEPSTIHAAQRSQRQLIESFAGMPSNDFLILGIKSRTDPERVVQLCNEGLPNFTRENYPAYFRELDTLANQYRSGVRNEFNREYVLAVKLSNEQSEMAEFLGREATPADPASVRDLEQLVFTSIPREYRARRTNPHHLRWIQQRFISRGVSVPIMPGFEQTSASFGPDSFPAFVFDKNAQADAYADHFAERYAAGERAEARKWFISRWHRAEEATMCAVIDPDKRTVDQPHGQVAYQQLCAVLSYPQNDSQRINSFTAIVDQKIGLDADFAQRITFDFSAVSKDGARIARSRLMNEADASADDDFDMQDYADQSDAQAAFRQRVRRDKAKVAVKVSTIFAFAHPNYRLLQERVAAVQTVMADNGFDLRTIPGGSEELFKLMAPGSPQSKLSRDFAQTATIPGFAASLPLRSTRIGAPRGFPVAINMENQLGQMVRMPLMTSTDSGSGSIASSGEPRGGKSYVNKKLLYAYLDMRAFAHIIDMSTHGEYAVAAAALPPAEVTTVYAARGSHSMDTLRVYADDPATARDLFLEQWLPMLQIDPKSPAGTALINLLDSRAGGLITSTRDLFTYLHRNGPNRAIDDPLRILYGAFLPYANATWATLLIDPLDPITGQVKRLPLLQRDHPTRLVVFRTNGLVPSRKAEAATHDPRELFSDAVYMAIARYTQERFARITTTCVTLIDEVAFIGNSRVPEILVKTPDKMGAKEKNIVITSTQLVEDLDENYSLIPYRMAFRQRDNANAEAALVWANVPVTPTTHHTITKDMSPLDVTGTAVQSGREGECYMNVNGIAKVKILPMPANRARMSDTTASRMIREDDMVPAGATQQ